MRTACARCGEAIPKQRRIYCSHRCRQQAKYWRRRDKILAYQRDYRRRKGRKQGTVPKAVSNRINAARSTGPRTAKGLATSSMNAVKHGALAKTALSVEQRLAIVEGLLASIDSADPTRWRLVRYRVALQNGTR